LPLSSRGRWSARMPKSWTLSLITASKSES